MWVVMTSIANTGARYSRGKYRNIALLKIKPNHDPPRQIRKTKSVEKLVHYGVYYKGKTFKSAFYTKLNEVDNECAKRNRCHDPRYEVWFEQWEKLRWMNIR